MQRRRRQRGEQRATLAPGIWQDAEHGWTSAAGWRVGLAQGLLRGELRGEGAQAIRDDPAAAAAQGTIAATARSVEGRRFFLFRYFSFFFLVHLEENKTRVARNVMNLASFYKGGSYLVLFTDYYVEATQFIEIKFKGRI